MVHMSDTIKRAKVVSKERVESLLHATSGPEWSFVFRLPTELRFGAGRLEETAELARGLGKRVLLVTSRHAMERLGYTEQLATALMSQGIEVVIYKDVHLNPTTGDVDQGAACA